MKKKHFKLVLDEETHAWLKSYAARKNRSIHGQILYLIESEKNFTMEREGKNMTLGKQNKWL